MRVIISGLVIAACGGNHGGSIDAMIDSVNVDTPADADPNNPLTLFDTGLCVDRACTQISAGITPYTPQFPLWSDTASKRRWYWLPPDTQIDTSDMDHWVFPVGTKFWKEFTRDDGMGNDVRVETRLIMRIGPGDDQTNWFYMPYEWNATNDDTTAQPQGVMNADGTQHDIPSRLQCRGCHENLMPSRILGFQAIQLDVTPAVGEAALSTLIAGNTLTANPTATTAPYFPLPGTATEQAALGYLHANCGHCHNPSSTEYQSGIVMQLRLTVGTLGSTATTPTYTTAVAQPTASPVGGLPTNCILPNNTPIECIITKGDPTDSSMIYRFEYTTFGGSIHMPALCSEMIDSTGDTTLRTWISGLQ